jgi:hypothetical protein
MTHDALLTKLLDELTVHFKTLHPILTDELPGVIWVEMCGFVKDKLGHSNLIYRRQSAFSTVTVPTLRKEFA